MTKTYELKFNTEIKTKVRKEEAGSDAITRYMKRKGFESYKIARVPGYDDRVYWRNEEYERIAVSGQLYNMEKEIVTFTLMKIF